MRRSLRSPTDIDTAVDAIRRWGEACAWTGWDPYDALNSPAAEVLSLGTPLGRRLLTQLVKTSPVNLRPLLRIPKARNAKGVALAASGYARLAAARHDERAAATALELVDWLAGAAVPSRTGSGSGWGYHFDVQTRFFRYPSTAPNVVATSFVVDALLDVRELLGDPRVMPLVEEAIRFLTGDLLVLGERPFFRYVDEEPALVHNANLLACAVLVRSGEPELIGRAIEPLRTTLRAQAEDGSWPYAAGDRGSWVDNFHTGYVLESLARVETALPELVGDALRRGVAFWERSLFTPAGRPLPNTRDDFPLDAHCYAQAIETWLALGRVAEAERLAALLVGEMLAPQGYVYFERRRLWTNRVPFVRWSTAPAFRALTRLLLAHANLD